MKNLQVGCMTLINALVASPLDLDFRVHLRNEVLRAGLGELLGPLHQDASDELGIQMKIFMDHKVCYLLAQLKTFSNFGNCRKRTTMNCCRSLTTSDLKWRTAESALKCSGISPQTVPQSHTFCPFSNIYYSSETMF